MTVEELMDELAHYDRNTPIFVEDLEGWNYDFLVSDETSDMSKITLTPLADTRQEDV